MTQDAALARQEEEEEEEEGFVEAETKPFLDLHRRVLQV